MNGNTASLTEKYGGTTSPVTPCSAQRLARPCSAPRSSRAAGRWPSRRTAPCATRAGSPRARTRVSSWIANCTFIRPTTFERLRHRDRLAAQLAAAIAADSENGGSEHAESPECTPACSMCSMMPPMTTSVPSQTASTSTSIASFRKRSSSTGESLRDLHRLAHVALEVARLVHDLHRAAAEHVRRPHDQRIADLLGGRERRRPRCARCGWAAAAARARWSICWKRSRSSAMSIMSGVVPMIGTPFVSRSRASLSGVCPPYCTITPHGLLDVRRSRARPRASAARSTGGRTCRSRSTRSPGCS